MNVRPVRGVLVQTLGALRVIKLLAVVRAGDVEAAEVDLVVGVDETEDSGWGWLGHRDGCDLVDC